MDSKKIEYEKPELEFIQLVTEDILAESGFGNDKVEGEDPWGDQQ